MAAVRPRASLFARNRSGVKYTAGECAPLNKKYRSMCKIAYEMIPKTRPPPPESPPSFSHLAPGRHLFPLIRESRLEFTLRSLLFAFFRNFIFAILQLCTLLLKISGSQTFLSLYVSSFFFLSTSFFSFLRIFFRDICIPSCAFSNFPRLDCQDFFTWILRILYGSYRSYGPGITDNVLSSVYVLGA